MGLLHGDCQRSMPTIFVLHLILVDDGRRRKQAHASWLQAVLHVKPLLQDSACPQLCDQMASSLVDGSAHLSAAFVWELAQLLKGIAQHWVDQSGHELPEPLSKDMQSGSASEKLALAVCMCPQVQVRPAACRHHLGIS